MHWGESFGMHGRHESCCGFEDFDGFFKLTVLALELTDLSSGIGGYPVTPGGVDPGAWLPQRRSA